MAEPADTSRPGSPDDLTTLSEEELLEGIARVVAERQRVREAPWTAIDSRKVDLSELDLELERWWQALRLLRSDGKQTEGVRLRRS